MIAEHTEMTQGMKPFAESWGLTPPSGPDEDCQKEMEKLDKLSGKDFDKEYIDQMVSDHSKAALALFGVSMATRPSLGCFRHVISKLRCCRPILSPNPPDPA